MCMVITVELSPKYKGIQVVLNQIDDLKHRVHWNPSVGAQKCGLPKFLNVDSHPVHPFLRVSLGFG